MSDDTPTVTQQYSFTVGEDGSTDGAIEPSEESVETSLEAFGADVDHREQDTRIDQPEASTFGLDDRPEVTSTDGGEQGALFADTEDDQQTLTGERAASQCLFETDDTPEGDEQDGERADEADTASDEPTDATTDASPRAVADGGYVEDDDTDEQDADRDDEPAESPAENEETTFDPDAETVTDAWTGAFIYTSWGYGQTNVEMAQIVEVSDSGKTVRARLVSADQADMNRGSESLRPSADQYGETFRLHVRNSRGDPAFRGSYPYINGNMDDGKRLDSFLPFDNTAGNTVHQTPTNHGH